MIGAHALGGPPQRDPPGLRQEILPPGPRRTAAPRSRGRESGYPAAAQRKRSPARDAQLPLDQVDAGDRLGHRMLDLQPRVHLHEVELAVGVEQELDRAGADVADGSRQRDRRRAHAARAAPRRRRARAPPRSASGAAAAPSSRARRDGPRCRAGRRRPGPRRGARRSSARSSISRAVAEGSSRLGARGMRARRQARARRVTSRMPRPPPPAAALTISGKPMRCAAVVRPRVALVVRLVARHARHAGRARDALAPRPCCPSAGSPPAAGRSRSARRRSRPARSPRSRRGSRSPDAPHRRPLRFAGVDDRGRC